jgi:hypothetical protein
MQSKEPKKRVVDGMEFDTSINIQDIEKMMCIGVKNFITSTSKEYHPIKYRITFEAEVAE